MCVCVCVEGGGVVEICSVEVALIIAGTLDHSQYSHLRIVTKGSRKRKMPCISPSILVFKNKEEVKVSTVYKFTGFRSTTTWSLCDSRHIMNVNRARVRRKQMY